MKTNYDNMKIKEYANITRPINNLWIKKVPGDNCELCKEILKFSPSKHWKDPDGTTCPNCHLWYPLDYDRY